MFIGGNCCCGCTFVDHDMPDAGSQEFLQSTGVDAATNATVSSQDNTDGATLNCRCQMTSQTGQGILSPCRKVSVDIRQDPAEIFAKSVLWSFDGGVHKFESYWNPATGRFDGGFPGNVYVIGAGHDLMFVEPPLIGGGSGYTWTAVGALVYGWDNANGINIADAQTYVIPGHTPGASTVTIYLGVGQNSFLDIPYGYLGLNWQQNWYRFYPAQVFVPDGGAGPKVGFKMNGRTLSASRTAINTGVVTDMMASGFDNVTNVPMTLAIRQGTTSAIVLNAIGIAIAAARCFDTGNPLGHWQGIARDATVWTSLTFKTLGSDPTGAIWIPFVPDLTKGAAPIEFGCMLQVGGMGADVGGNPNAGWYPSSSRLQCVYRVDEFCLTMG